jgi:hypothetical protein
MKRYGLQWNGPDKFVCTEMADGLWTTYAEAEAAIKAAVLAEREDIIALLLRIELKDHQHFAAYGSSGYLTGSDYVAAIRARGEA